MSSLLQQPKTPERYLRLTPKVWEDFEKTPEWLAIKEVLSEAHWQVMQNLSSNKRLHTEGRDNFPELKFERGKAFAIETIINFPSRFANEVRIKENIDAKRRGSKERGYPGKELLGNERGTNRDD